MLNPWDEDEIVASAAYSPASPAGGNPWDQDEIVGEAPALEIDIVGGTPESATQTQPSGAGPSFAERELRGLGLGARSVLQGAGSLIGAVGGDAFNKIMPGDQPSYRDAASALADRIGLPSPQDGRERVLGDVGEALTGTGLTMGVGGGINALAGIGRGAAAAQPANRLAQLLTAQPGLQVASTATGAGASSITRESGGSQGQQLAAGLVGGLAPGAAGYTAGATTRGLVRGTSGQQMTETIADFNALGASPSVGQASGNRAIQGVENVLAKAPTSTGVMTNFAERQAEDIGGGLQRLANSTSPNASAERAGRAVERGADSLQQNTSATKRALYWQADQFIPGSTPVAMGNTWQALTEMTRPTAGAAATTGAMANQGLIRLRDNLMKDLSAGNGQIPYEALKSIRSRIGEQMTDYSMQPETSARELRRLYASLSRDMETAAQAQGPEAVRAARRANNYTRAAADRMEQVQRVIDKNGGPERVYAAAVAGTKDGGTTLRAVMQSLPKDGQRAVTAAVIKRMGMATPGAQDAAGDVFSAGTFMTNWNTVSTEAKRALFDRYGPQFSRDMDRLARVADNIKQGGKVFQNPSGSAHVGAAYTYGAALVGSMFTGGTGVLLASGAGANALARVLTSPRAVSWLARTTTIPRGSIPAAINSMRVEGQREGDESLMELASELEDRVQEVPSAPQD